MNPPLNVLHVLGELRASGAEVMLLDAVPLMRAAGVEPIMLSTGEAVGSFAARYEGLGVAVHHVPFERHPRFARALQRFVRDHAIDVVHVHTERANAVVGVAVRLTGARVVRTVHNVFTYTGRLRAVRTLERGLLRSIGVRHIAIGEAVEANERDRLRNATVRVDNWVGPRFRPPAPEERSEARRVFEIDEGAVVVASIGNCSPVKNHTAVIEALPKLAERAGTIVYLHAGMGAAEADERRLANELGRSSTQVRFLGTVGDVRPLLWATDVYCMPSLYEGVAIAALEALACGLPSVFAEVPGLRTITDPTPGARFVAPTSDGVAAGLAAVLADLDGARSDAARTSARVKANHSAEAQVARLVRLYRSSP